MTPEILAAIGGLIDRYGLPLAMLAGLGWLLLTRRVVLGSELTYVEQRRVEEREGRLAAEAALREVAPKTAEALEAMADAIEGRAPRARR